ncbi:MAG: sulfatase-like hydrolase/transferase [Acidobacteriota bacterium]
MRRYAIPALGGMGLATAFFMPIAAAGTIGAPMLMWSGLHTVELVCAWLVWSTVAGFGLGWIHDRARPRREAAVTFALALPSLLSLLATTGRNAVAAGEGPSSIRLFAVSGLAVGLIVAAVLWLLWPRILRGMLRGMLPFGVLLLIPTVPALLALPMPHRSGFAEEAVTATATATSGARSAEEARLAAGAGPCRDTYVLLLDELAYDAAFSDGRATLPSLVGRMASSRVYHRALAPTASTDSSISSYVSSSAKRGAIGSVDAAGIFSVAQAAGMDTEVMGWYYPYCESLASLATRCRAFSMYNAATSYDGFSLTAPIETVFNIWPYQMPTGLMKRPFAVRLHRAELAAITAGAGAPPPARPVFRWVHFNVPHLPWLDETGFLAARAFDPTREHYLRQVEEADRALGATFAAIDRNAGGRPTTVVVTADHGSRAGLAGDPLHVPLVIWTPNGAHQDINDEVRVADILKSVVSSACRPR